VATGSHLDSVPDGGAFDGPLGVISAFLALDLLRSEVGEPARPVGVVDWSDEEGARFGVACVGSRLATGVLTADRARGLTDAAGVTLAGAVRAAGLDPEGLGADDGLIGALEAFVELHVEQGRGLAGDGAPIGLATGIWPHGRWRIDLDGEANHAGTTKLEDRLDPTLPLAAAIEAARAAAMRHGALATVGRLNVVPNATNAVPSSVQAWLDARASDETTLRAVVGSVSAAVDAAAAHHRVRCAVVEESFTPAVELDDDLRRRLDAALGGVPALPTGAGHDAGILAARLPTAMIFVRNPTGVSHSPEEHADLEDCAAGVRALARALAVLVA
jgi:N-carbamoyl-L-amino-acid hydrolase